MPKTNWILIPVAFFHTSKERISDKLLQHKWAEKRKDDGDKTVLFKNTLQQIYENTFEWNANKVKRVEIIFQTFSIHSLML